VTHRGEAWHALSGGAAKAASAGDAGSYASMLARARERVEWFASGAARRSQRWHAAAAGQLEEGTSAVRMTRGAEGGGAFGLMLKPTVDGGGALVHSVAAGGQAEGLGVGVGLGRMVALYHRSSILQQIREHTRYLCF
jgi:hypothetical protein